jgi:hypothetical protein
MCRREGWDGMGWDGEVMYRGELRGSCWEVSRVEVARQRAR